VPKAALEEAVRDPDEPLKLETLKAQIALMAKTDAQFHEELEGKLKDAGVATVSANQHQTTIGNDNDSAQISGQHNSVTFGSRGAK